MQNTEHSVQTNMLLLVMQCILERCTFDNELIMGLT